MSMLKRTGTFLATALAAATVCTAPTLASAHAATPAVTSRVLAGSPSRGAEARLAAVTETCNSLNNGKLCLKVNGSTVGVSYHKTSGGHITARFKYTFRGEDHWDNGWFTQYPNETKSFAWDNQSLGCGDIIGQLVVDGERTYSTPPINPCG
ncbi:hypothetical protein [Streptomyces orinoci]|uniref:Secreted protein n=1 Tax=Streptomyces orinoci TaxID=67339 RepID=A0ABV3JYC1_STRON|nr:hypothetical protein [Streptomyces orinoci]